MPHSIEEIGINLLMEQLRKNGHEVKRLRGTFDLDVDGQLAEVKTKTKCFAEMDFISLTQKQWEAAKIRNFDVYIVCNVNSDTPEIYKVSSQALLKKVPRIITSYEYDKNLVKDVAEPL
jgi:hypothetical protein